MNDVTVSLIRRAYEARIDGATSLVARASLLDWLGVAIAGSRDQDVLRLTRLLCAEGGGDAQLIGQDMRLRAADAALANGMASHALDYDDGLPAMSGHASVAILPALFALAATRTVPGHAFIASFIVATEAAGCIGRLVAPHHYDRGYHATATVGALAAALGCAHLLELDEESTACALGLAATRAGGLKASFGTAAKPLHAGWAAMLGLTAAQWSQAGIGGPRDILGDPQGFPATMGSGADLEAAMAPAPGGAHILDTRFKRYTSCGVTHSVIDAIADTQPPSPDRITEVIVLIGRGADRICNIAAPRSGLEAKFSLRAVVAMALSGIDLADPKSFSLTTLERPDVSRLMASVRVELEDWPVTRATIRLHCADGTILESVRDGARRPECPEEAWRQVSAKFGAIVGKALDSDRATALIAAVETIERSSDVHALLARTTP